MDEVDPLGGDVPAGGPAPATGMWRLVTTWWASDPSVVEGLAWINSLPMTEPIRHEAEAGLHMLQARWAWAKADQLRAQQATEERRKTRLAAGRANDGRRIVTRGRCSECPATVRLRLDGTVRAHDPGSGAAQSLSPWGATGRQRCPGSGRPPLVV